MIYRLARDNEISKKSTCIQTTLPVFFHLELQPTFFQMVCPCCFTFFIPGKNCIQRFYTKNELKRIKKIKKKNKTGNVNESCSSDVLCGSSDIKYIIYSSQLSSYEKIKYTKETLFTTFKCTKCKSLIVHDSSPLEFCELKHKISKPSAPNSKPNRENLQKVLQKSQSVGTVKKEMDLESFLKGFI